MTALGARTVTALALAIGVALASWRLGLLRADYWAQLEPWVPFLIGGFAVVCAALVFGVWRLGERSEYYFRLGEPLAWGTEIALGGWPGRTLFVGHAPQIEVVDLPPAAQRVLYVAVFIGVGVVAVNNRAVALLRDAPKTFAHSSSQWCPEPAAPEAAPAPPMGCSLLLRAYQLGYAKELGSCQPKAAAQRHQDVCQKRQRDEPYLHYAWRLLDGWNTALDRGERGRKAPGMIGRFESEVDHVPALFDSTIDSVAMRPRSSHHLFTNLPDPRPGLGERVATPARGCGARLAHLAYFPATADTAAGRSELLEHVLDQLLFNPAYKPVVAQCGETIVHWGAPIDVCARLVAEPRAVLAEQGALDAVSELLAWRQRKSELAKLHLRELGEPAPAGRIASFQCLMFAGADQPPVERDVVLDGETLAVRDTRMAPLGTDGASQIRLYKRLAELLAEGFGYGRLTSFESVAAEPEDTAMVAAFRDPSFQLTKLDLMRDADLFLGNEWLTERAELLAVYPYHLHLKNFVEIFRRQYQLHRGRL